MMMRRALALVCVCAGVGFAADPNPSSESGDGVGERLVTVTIPSPESSANGTVQDLPSSVTALLKDGWRISQTTTLGKTTDGKGYVLVLTMDRSGPMGLQMSPGGPMTMFPGLPPGMAMRPHRMPQGQSEGQEPGRADPVKPSPERDIHVRWDDGSVSHLEIGAPVGSRNAVTVTTSGADGSLEVNYPAIAFLDDQETLHIDARGEPVAGPQANGFSPDSFAIQSDGTVTTMDDNGQGHTAHVVDAEVEKVPGHTSKPKGHEKHDM